MGWGLVLFVAFAALMLASAFFSSAETVFFSLSPPALRRIAARRPERAARVRALLAEPTQLLATVLIGNTIVNVALAVVGYALTERMFPGRGLTYSIPAVTVLLVIFGEAGPKRVALLLAERLAPVYAPVLRQVERALAPLRYLLERLTQKLAPLMRARGKTLSEEDFETALEIGREVGVLNMDELALIKAIIRLEDLRAHDVMTPRVDIIGVEASESPDAVLEKARAARRSFLPIYQGQLDSIEGFLDVRKFLLDPLHQLEKASIPAYFVPENLSLSRLLVQFQRNKLRIAVVVDEYGGTAGLITRGDILEVMTSEIYSEMNKPQPVFQPAGPHRWLVDPNISLEEINRKLRLRLSAEGAERLSGWIAAHAGHVPQQGDVVEAQGCRVEVLQTLKQRVTLVQIEKKEAAG